MGKYTSLIVLSFFVSACAPVGYPASIFGDGENISEGELDEGSGRHPGEPGQPAQPPGVPDKDDSQAVVPPFPEGAEKFNRPWANPETMIVIDAYQGNPINWDKMATDPRVVGVIHRSSIGMRVDTKYIERRKIAKERGYLWGAYHLGSSGDPIAQAKLFLQTIGDDPETLMILDLEDTSAASMMNIPDSILFMEYVRQMTGRIPVVYANHSTTKALNAALSKNELFRSSKLWYARFRPDIPDFPKGIWSSYFLWQFSSEINCSKTGTCLYNVPGTEFDMDINVYYGSYESLKSHWY